MVSFGVATFRITPRDGGQKNANVQLWNANAKWIYPMQEKRVSKEPTYLSMWSPFQDQFKLISNDSLPQYMLTGDQKHAILSNTQAYEPQYAYEGPRDFYLLDLNKGKKELLLTKQAGYPVLTMPSPTGKYIAYFREKHWWVYDIEKKAHTNITKDLGASFWHNDKEHPRIEEPYGDIGWTPDDQEILLYDQYDIWAIRPDGSAARRLTRGREKQAQFRLAGYASYIQKGKLNYDGRIHDRIDLNKDLMLETTDSAGSFGYYKWSAQGIKEIAFARNSRPEQLIHSADGHSFAYTEQRYDLPPRLMLQAGKEKTAKTIVQSNPQHYQFHWGKAEVIQYKNAKGKSLKAMLYYPAQYDSSKKYPMIVFIYEKLTPRFNNLYLNPSLFYAEDGGFSISSFTTQGYFVLAPDISYEIGDPGISASDCVVSATKEVISRGLVNPGKIGLAGHSFGGYQTNFIITQTNLFAAAIAGSAWTDLTNTYLTVNWSTGVPDMWRFESQQLRMKASLFDDQEAYDRNSPIRHVKNITTPQLSWTGDQDYQVNWGNTVSLYLAMRRLQKKHIMLLYPNEGHSLSTLENSLDLSRRFHEWFDFHLKDVPAAPWIKRGLK